MPYAPTPGGSPTQVLIAGVLATPLVRIANLTITDVLNEQPNTAALTVNQMPHLAPSAPFAPRAFDAVAFVVTPTSITYPAIRRGQPIEITTGGQIVFGGEIVTVQQYYELERPNEPSHVAYHLQCTDHTRALNRRKVTKSYLTTSATAIVQDLIATYAPGFSAAAVAPNLPAVAIDFTFEEMNRALTRLANRIGGYWYVDYSKIVHVFLSEPADPPAPLVPGEAFSALTFETDLSQIRTRVTVEGAGTTITSRVNLGETMIPVRDPGMFPTTGGLVRVEQAQIRYTGVIAGGQGSLVGPGAQPGAGPTATPITGAGIEDGVHQYAVTWTSAAGESLPSPRATVTLGHVDPPGALTALAPTPGSGPNPGVHHYAVSFVTATGETTPGAVSAPVTTTQAGGVGQPGGTIHAYTGVAGNLQTGVTYSYATTFITATGETLRGVPSPAITVVRAGGDQARVTIPTSSDPRVIGRKLYRRDDLAAFRYLATVNNTTATEYLDNIASVATQPDEPSVDTTGGALTCVVPLEAIPIGPASVTARKLYRSAANQGAALLRLVATIANNTQTTYTDTATDAALGAAAPATNTTDARRVLLGTLPLGSTGVTGRKIYRTAAGASLLQLLTTIADTVTTSYTDAASDATLGASAPIVDTSGLQQPPGQVNAGSPSLIVSGTSAFSPTGGFAVVGNGEQVIRYTGVTATALTGIPASGPGALTSTVAYNASVTVAPALTGIPAAGAGALTRALIPGLDVNLLTVRDEATAQAALAAIEGGDGVIEHYLQDRRLSPAGAATTAEAELGLFAQPEIRVRYSTRDPHTRSGKTIAIDLPAPTSLAGAFLIQRVQLTQFDLPHVAPLRSVEASSTRFSFEDVLRRLELEIEA